MADGCVEMVFHYRSAFDEITADELIESSPIASIQAQSTRHRRFVTNQSFGIFGAYLYPFAIPRLFGYPASDFTNISPDLASVFGKEGTLLDEKMCNAPTNNDRIAIVSDFLTKKLDAKTRELPTIFRSIHTVLANKGSLAVEDLAAEHNISKRQFERRFKELAGLPPKLYSRVTRFQAATQFKLNGTRRPDGDRLRLRLLRPVTLHQRLPRILRLHAQGILLERRRGNPISGHRTDVAFFQLAKRRNCYASLH